MSSVYAILCPTIRHNGEMDIAIEELRMAVSCHLRGRVIIF